MRKKTTKEELIKDIVDLLVQCDWTTVMVLWNVADMVIYTQEKFDITFNDFSYNTPIKETYDEKNQLLSLQILAPKKQKQVHNNPKTG